MIIRNIRAVAFLAVAMMFAVAGCGGGGSKALPTMPQGQLGSKVGVTFTFRIGGSSTQSGSQRSPKYLPTTTQSIVIEYIGDNPAATPAPGSTPGTTATVAATVNVTTSGSNPPPAGSCFNNAGSLICTVNVQLPVGVLDLYILAYDGQNGTGNLVAGNVTIVQVAKDGALTNPGTTTPVSIVLGANPTSIAFNAISNIVPNGTPNPAATPTSYPNNAVPFVYSGAGTMNLGGVPANTTINNLTLTDNDTSGASCLVYIPAGATTATPCPMSSAKSSVTLSNSSDTYAVLYNGKFLPGGAVSISATGASSPLSVQITPTIFALSVSVTGATGPIGAVVYDSVGKNMYVGMASATTPLYAISYSASTGYGTPVAVNVASVNGAAASTLSATVSIQTVVGGPNAMLIGPDNNIWMVEKNYFAEPQYVAVAVINSAVVNPANGSMIQPGPGVFAEYTLAGPNFPASGLLKDIVAMGGFIWIMDKDGDIWRINPATGVVNPNLGAAYAPGQGPTSAQRVTDPTGTTAISGLPGTNNQTASAIFSPLIALNGLLYVADAQMSSLDILSVDTSASPSAGLCTTAGPPPCIATFVRAVTGQLGLSSFNEPNGTTTDGTSLYIVNVSTDHVSKVTPPSTLTTSQSAYSTPLGGLAFSPDGWLWTLSASGAEALQGFSSTSPPIAPTSVTACDSNEDVARGAQPFIAGPDGTWFFSPNTSRASPGTAGLLCAVVY
ncbi:MAG: hypothetical protein ACRENA_17310 [Vulcanimicrobiaceae bacterium]